MLAHTFAVVGFILLPIGLLGLHGSLRATAVERRAYWAVVLTIAGVGLTLPFYGGSGLVMFAVGLLVALGTALLAAALWRYPTHRRVVQHDAAVPEGPRTGEPELQPLRDAIEHRPAAA